MNLRNKLGCKLRKSEGRLSDFFVIKQEFPRYSCTGLASTKAQMLWTILPVHTYCLGGFDGGRVLDSPGLSVSVTVGDCAGTGGGGALSSLYNSLGTSFMSSSTGSRPVCVCVCVCLY